MRPVSCTPDVNWCFVNKKYLFCDCIYKNCDSRDWLILQ